MAPASDPVPEALKQNFHQDLIYLPAASTAQVPRAQRALATAAYAEALHHYKKRQWEAALAYFQSSAAADPTFTPAFAHATLCLLLLERPDEALDLIERTRKRHPRAADLATAEAIVHYLRGDTSKAAAAAEFSRTLQPALLANYYILAHSAITSQKPQRVRELFHLAQKVEPPVPTPQFYSRQAHLWAALLLLDKETTPEQSLGAIQPFFARAESFDPDNTFLQFQTGMAAFAAGDYQLAADRLKIVHQARPDDEEILDKLMICYLRLRQWDNLIPPLEIKIQMNPDMPRLYFMLAETCRFAERWEEAVRALIAYHQLVPHDSKTLFAQVEAQYEAGHLDDCIASTLIGQTAYPSVPIFPYYRALALNRQGQPAMALVAFKETEKLAAENYSFLLDREFYFRKGFTGKAANDLDTMEAAFKKCLQLDPEDHEVMNILGYSWAEKGLRLKEALQLIRRAVQLDPKNGDYLDSLAWVYYQMGDYSRALNWIQKAVALSPDDPIIHDHLGDIHARLGQNEKAIAAWQKALNLFHPDPDTLRQKITTLESSRR